jgi:hypothetical protein
VARAAESAVQPKRGSETPVVNNDGLIDGAGRITGTLDPAGNVYVADGNNNKIDVFSSCGTFISSFVSFSRNEVAILAVDLVLVQTGDVSGI